MSQEESDMKEVIREHFSDAEILGCRGQILSMFKPHQFFK
jgi:hypothetical protein